MRNGKRATLVVTTTLLIIALLAMCLLLRFLFNGRYKKSNLPAAYEIIYSDMFSSNKGGMITIDDQGGIIGSKPLDDLQDAFKYSYEDGVFVAGGHRHNTHLIVGKNSESKLVHLLSDSNYSGVMSIEPHNGGIAAVMNGNDSPEHDSYLNLLVVEDSHGKVLEKRVLKIYTEDQVSTDEDMFIVGHELTLSSNRYQGKIIRYNFSTKNIDENVTDDNLLYNQTVLWGGRLLAVGTDLNGSPKQIDVFDANTLGRVASMRVESNFQSLLSVGERPWIISSTQACQISDGSYDIDHSECLGIPVIKDTQYVAQAIASRDKALILVRDKTMSEAKGIKTIGSILAIDTKTGDSVITPVRIPSSKSADSILFLPYSSR